jgi:hypothetical protein
MSAPLPLSGQNPYTLGYQKRQFKVQSTSLPGSNAVHNGKVGPQTVFDSLVSPPAAGVIAEEQTPLVEEAEFFNLTPQTITVSGTPTSFSFQLVYEGIPTTTLTQASDHTAVQAALVAVSTIGAGNATVVGPAGGPWTVTLLMAPPLSLLAVQSLSFVGGTDPEIVVTSPAQQPGIIPY